MITLIKGTEAACGTNAAGASTFGSATAVRLVNNSATARLVTESLSFTGLVSGSRVRFPTHIYLLYIIIILQFQFKFFYCRVVYVDATLYTHV